MRRLNKTFVLPRMAEWLKNMGLTPEFRDYPDIVAEHGDEVHGFQVMRVSSIAEIASSRIFIATVDGLKKKKRSDIARFTLIIQIPTEDAREALDNPKLLRRSINALSQFPIDSFVIGAIIDGEFDAIHWHNKSPNSDLD